MVAAGVRHRSSPSAVADVIIDNIGCLRSKVFSVNMGPMTTIERPYHHGDLRAELVRIAREFVRQSGAEGWSMREAARKAGVSQAAPYRHFAAKAELLDAVSAEAYAELELRYQEAVRANADHAQHATAVAQAYLRFAFDEPQLFRLIFASARLHGTKEAKSSYREFERAVKNTQLAGGLPAGSTTMLAHALWCSVHGVADLVLSGSFGRRHGQDVARVLLNAIFQGLRPG
jgi:AcrR family transcriptional regulator